MRHIGFILGIAVAGVLSLSAAAQRGEAKETGQLLAQLEASRDLSGTAQFARETSRRYNRVPDTRMPPRVQHIDVKFPTDVIRYGRSIGPFRVTTLDILVEPDGRAGDVRIAQSSGFDAYDSAALAGARDAIYRPALDRGRPVERRMLYDVSFGFLCNRAAGNTTCDYRTYPETCSATVCALLLR
jgi:TonB family protein